MTLATKFINLLASSLGLALLAGQVIAEPQPAAPELSQAETLLWMTDQLQTIERPVEIRYRFDRTGTMDTGFTDTVTFIVDAVKNDGMKSAQLQFFTGERTFDVDPVASTNVNPVLKIYLQGDVYEMNRLTDPEGQSRERWRYFQRRIKYALAESAVVEDVVVAFGGEQHSAKKIRFNPYVNDPKRKLYEQFAKKSYSIVVSDDLAGYLYSIETVVLGDIQGAPPLIKERLQLIDIAPITN